MTDTYSYWLEEAKAYERNDADMEAMFTLNHLSQYIGNMKSKNKASKKFCMLIKHLIFFS